MAEQTVACPQCQTALRSKVALAPDAMVRCPQCGNHFLGTASLSPSPIRIIAPRHVLARHQSPVTPGRLRCYSFRRRSSLCCSVPERSWCTYCPTCGRRTPPPTVVDDQRERELAEKQRQLDLKEQEIDAQREKLANRNGGNSLKR